MGGLRELSVIVPTAKADDVIDVLKSRKGRVKFVHRVSSDDGFTARISCFTSLHGMGRLLTALDSIGCGVAYGRIAVTSVEVIKPLPKRVDDVAAAERLRKRTSGDVEAGAATPAGGGDDAAVDSQRCCAGLRVEGSAEAMAIEEIYTTIQGGCVVSFDFLALVAVASLIAGLGLATNNTVMIVASMLLSPLMSPILGFTLGTALKDWGMVRAGFKTEAAGLAMTLFIGCLIGVVFAPFAESFSWPTNEMESRGVPQSLLIGVAFAVPSGVGVALSTTGGGSNALVGVAIAASLLPPVVNAGMCLVFAWFGKVIYTDSEFSYDAQQFLKISGLSVCLFLINVAIIYAVALAIFRLKRIQPVRRQLDGWHDLPTALTKTERAKMMASIGGSDKESLGDSAGEGAAATGGMSRAERRAARKAEAKRAAARAKVRGAVKTVGAKALDTRLSAEEALARQGSNSTVTESDDEDEAEDGADGAAGTTPTASNDTANAAPAASAPADVSVEVKADS